jgi:hypothetical protein
MKVSPIAAVGLVLGVAVLASRRSSNPERVATPTPTPTPDPAPDAPTLSMMRAATPPTPTQGSWSRLVAHNHSAQRSKVCNPNTGNCFSVPATILFGGQQLASAVGWLAVRLWCETSWSPVREENRPAASYWAWLGEIKRSTALPSIVRNAAIVGSGLPAASWIQSGARISVDNMLQVSWRYPGNEHTGIERGRDYDIVLEWRTTPTKPQ